MNFLKALQYIPFIVNTIEIITKIDTNCDGNMDGKEKMEAVKKEVILILKTFPELAKNFDENKTQRFIQALVDALNIIIT